MKFNWKSLVLAIMITGCTSGYCGQESVTCRESGTSFAKEAVMPFIESGEIPGIINVFSKGNVQETTCAGWADVDKKIPMSMDRMFMQCSQTKGFCGVTVAMLIEEGKISLDDPVAKYLPEFKELKVKVKGKKKPVAAKNVLGASAADGLCWCFGTGDESVGFCIR